MFGSGSARRCRADEREGLVPGDRHDSDRWRRRRPSGGSAGPASPGRSRSSRSSSVTVCAAKNSGVQRLAVASQATALAPFSQNSKDEVCFGSGQAQPGQSKPSGWFMRSSVALPLIGMPCSVSAWPVACSAPQPPAGSRYPQFLSLTFVGHPFTDRDVVRRSLIHGRGLSYGQVLAQSHD